MADESPFTSCYVGFLDLMGVQNLVKAAESDSELCGNVVAALEETKNMSSFVRESRCIGTGETKRWSLQVQAFSDCVVLFIPTESTMLPWLLASIRRLHDRLVRLNVPIRGGITIGGMHWDDDWSKEPFGDSSSSENDASSPAAPVAFGEGLVTAYKLEDGTAVYPRILISELLYTHIVQQGPKGKAFPLAMSGRLIEFIRQDFDGLWHLDVLHEKINRRDLIRQERSTDEEGKHVVQNIFDETTYTEWLEDVRRFIKDGRAAVNGEKLEAKYMWLANYYNEKVKGSGSKPIRWIEGLVPEGAIKATFIQKSNDK